VYYTLSWRREYDICELNFSCRQEGLGISDTLTQDWYFGEAGYPALRVVRVGCFI
jgi:hypothetical protein